MHFQTLQFPRSVVGGGVGVGGGGGGRCERSLSQGNFRKRKKILSCDTYKVKGEGAKTYISYSECTEIIVQLFKVARRYIYKHYTYQTQYVRHLQKLFSSIAPFIVQHFKMYCMRKCMIKISYKICSGHRQ
jgi:hypothetical protein